MLLILVIVEAIIIVAGAIKLLRIKYDGAMVVTQTDEKKTFSLEINTNPDELDQKKQIVLKVTNLLQGGARE